MVADPISKNQKVCLDRYDNRSLHRGAPYWKEALWVILQALFVSSWLPGSKHRAVLLRWFGAAISVGVVIKPRVRVKCPWRLKIGDHSWIGEGAFIDNLAEVEIGTSCCISQEAYLCTGSHDWSKSSFELILKPIIIGDGAWIAARAIVAPGVNVGAGAVLSLGSVATQDLASHSIYQGNPAKVVKERRVF